MFEFLQDGEDAIVILKADHEKVKGLFDRFARSETKSEKKKIAAETIMELKIHTAIEEGIFYPTVRPHMEKNIMNEADEEHHVAKLLVAELEVMDGTEEHYDAKYKVLSESVRHHIREEEKDMFPKVRVLGLDFVAIGRQLLARKKELKESGVDVFAEEEMVRAVRNRGDSPAATAEKVLPFGSRAKAKRPVKASAKRHKAGRLTGKAKTALKRPSGKMKQAKVRRTALRQGR